MLDTRYWILDPLPIYQVYPPSQKTTGLPVDECANNQYATARCRPEAEADNRVVGYDEDILLRPVCHVHHL